MKKLFHRHVAQLLLIACSPFVSITIAANEDARPIPAYSLPVPTTVSEEMQKIIARPLHKFMSIIPANHEDWHQVIAERQSIVPGAVARLQTLFPVSYEAKTRDGVNTYTVTPKNLSSNDEEKVLFYLHGGAYVFFAGEGCLLEAIPFAHYSNYQVVALDYRMPPESPFPAALDDAVAVYKDLLKEYKPENIALGGTSAGGGLAAALLLKLQELKLPLPAAAVIGTPWSDITETGDTYFTNKNIDDILISYGEFGAAAAKLYAGEYDLKDPLISPVYGSFSKEHPPVILVSGTRDLLLSCTVRLHQKYLSADIPAELLVFEGMSHAFYVVFLETPESKEAFREMSKFLRKHLN